MTDPISAFNAALALFKLAGEQLKTVRERAQTTKDVEIKAHVGELYDTMNGLREAFSRLADENRALKQQIENEHMARVAIPEIRQVGETNYYFQGDKGPYCQVCYIKDGKLVALPPQQHRKSGSIRRECPICQHSFYEKKGAVPQQLVPRVERYT